MKKILLTFLIASGLTIGAVASSPMEYKVKNTTKPISNKQLKKMDHSHSKRKAVKRNFKTKKEFHHKTKKNLAHKQIKQKRHTGNRYNNGYSYTAENSKNNYHTTRQRGHRHPNKGWVLAYRYDKASFYDREGFYYGYFNRHGYYFEDVFYRYDRYYGFKDRVRGRGLFDHRYYMPANARYYGFCSPRHQPRAYSRAY